MHQSFTDALMCISALRNAYDVDWQFHNQQSINILTMSKQFYPIYALWNQHRSTWTAFLPGLQYWSIKIRQHSRCICSKSNITWLCICKHGNQPASKWARWVGFRAISQLTDTSVFSTFSFLTSVTHSIQHSKPTADSYKYVQMPSMTVKYHSLKMTYITRVKPEWYTHLQ